MKPNLKVGEHAKYARPIKPWVRTDRLNTAYVTLSRTSFKRWQITTRNCHYFLGNRSLYKTNFTNETTAMLCVQAILGAQFERVSVR